VKNSAVIFLQNVHGCAWRFFTEGSYRKEYQQQISLFRRWVSSRSVL